MKTKRYMLFVVLLAGLLAATNTLTAQTIRYVTAAGTGGGTSWSDASGDLQGMINASNANDQVWVAKGTYYPTTTTDQSLYFSMKNGVKIYGSFAGTEIVFTDRTSSVMAANPSVLSGDIDKNNILDNGNSSQVIYNGGNITASAVLDGFTVSGGYNLNGNGGGMDNEQSNPTVSNCTFSGNYAKSGGGMLNYNSSPVISNCSFSDNYAQSGGGMFNYNSSPVISNCSFSGNTASLGGAGLSNNYFSNPAIINCIFSGNSAENGGGIEIYFSSTATITNCTFSGNSAFDGGGILNDGSGSAIITNCSFSGNSGGSIQTYSNSNTTVTNSISWGDDSEIGNSDGGTSSVTNSIVQGGYPGTGNLNVDPRFVNQPPVALAAGGNLRLQQTSCAIDAGNNSGLSSGITTDLAGNPRIYNNGIVDMGAYEYQGTKQAYVYIPPATTTGNALNFDGTDDYVSLSTSDLTACTGTIPAVSNAITIAYWFKGTNIQSAVRFQDSHGFIVAGWTGTGATALHILSNDGGTTGIAVGAAATDGNWHHVAMTWQQGAANGFKSYLDGQLIAQRDAGNTSLPAINSLFLGSQGGNSEFMNGSLDEVQVWNTALSQAAIQAGMSGITAPQTGLLMYYKFDHGVANGNNSGVNQLLNSASPNIYAGTLYNFALTGTSSNWVNGFIQPATTTDSSSSNPSCQGSSVTFTSTVLINGNTAAPANTGTVTFTQGTTVLAGNVAVDANGHAAFSTDTLGAGSHLIVATYNAPTGFSTSNGSVNQVVNARPTGLISGGATYCNGSGTTTNLTITVTGTGTISGTLSDNTPFSGTAPTINVSVSPTVTTNYTIKSLTDAGCTAQSSDFSGSATVTVNARPTGSISGGATYCNGSGTTTNLTITVTGTGTISGTLSDNTPFSGTAPTINVSVSPTVTTNYTIKSLSDAGCTAQSSDFSGSATVTVNARPTGYISGGATYCSGSNTTTNLTLTVTGSGTVKGTLSDNTPFSGTAPTISVAVSPTATTIYTIATLNDANCTALSSDLSGNATVAINATPDPPASGGNQAQCQQSPIQTLTATATGGVITWYNMATGGSVVANPTLSNVGSITYYAQASNGNCSSATRTAVTLTINPLPAVAAITYTGNTTVCSGAVVALTDLTAGGVWSTSGNSAAVSSSGTVTFATVSASTPVTVYYTVSGSGCSANAPVVFTVNPPIILKPITGNSTVCGIGATTQLSEATGGGAWSSSNTAVAVVSAAGLVTGKGIGSAIIYYAASSGGCTASVQTNVAVNTGTTIAAITGGNQVIKSCSIQLSDATKGGAWSSSNTAVATVSTTGLVKGIAAGNCLIYYTVSSGVCSVPVSKSITVYNPLTAAVTAGKILCNGGTTTVTITASGGSGGYQYSLNAGRFQVSNTFTVAAGSYIIIITDQMANQFTLSGIIVTQPAALAIKLVSQTNATGKTTANGVFAVSGSGGTAPYQYSTNGGAGYQASGTFTALVPGSYKVSVKDANNCVALNYLTVSVGYNTKSSAVGATELLASNEDDNDETVSASVYPNPTISSFNVKLKSGKDQVVDIRVMDILGRMVYHTTGSATATYQFGNNFIKGTYIVQVIYEKSAKTFKVLKQ